MIKDNLTRVQKHIAIVFTLLGTIFLIAALILILVGINFEYDMQTTLGMEITALTLMIIGLVFFIIGIAFLIYCRGKKRLAAKLLATGTRVIADIEDIAVNPMMRLNNRSPYVIYCSWRNPKDGVTYHFKSHDLWFNPAKTIEEKGIKTVQVFMSPNNKKKYYVSLAGIEENHVFL